MYLIKKKEWKKNENEMEQNGMYLSKGNEWKRI